ncbi:MAG: NAD-dependent epimerase/dehydratase family protein [Flavobacteriales bacterium]|nr:NAD-dependent epimerase/dehydratase family protein [Flavobacteriales bacterium]
MSKITITGYSGFVGKNLSSYFLSQGYEVQKLGLRDESWRNVMDYDSDALVHLAGIAHDTQNSKDDSEYYKVNTDLTKEVFDAFLNSNIKDFIFFSSVKASADRVHGVLTEERTPNPKTHYGISKRKAEEYILSKKLPDGKRVFIVRPCMIHGPGNKGNLNLLYNIVKKGVPYPLASYINKRSFLSIDNLSFLIHQLVINSNIESGVYNLADDHAISTNKLVKIISTVLNKKAKLYFVSKKPITLVARIGDRVKLPLNSERLKKLTENYVVSNKKIKEAIGIDQLPTSTREGLYKTIKSFK